MLRVGLTGGIACGKSRVAERLAAAGCHVLDLDRVSHELIAPGGAAYADVVAEFGVEVLCPDRTVDRAVLGRRVFADSAARARLEAIVHPLVRAADEAFAARFESERAAVVVTDGALLVEAGLHRRYERLVVVACTPEEQLLRLRTRDGLSEGDARARIAAQMPIDEKRALADYELWTSGTPQDTDRRADELARELKRVALEDVQAG